MKILFFKCLGVGAGFALATSIIIGLVIYFVSLPKSQPPWNQNAVTASFAEMSANTGGDHNFLIFNYIVNNATDRDYRIASEKESLFIELPDEGGLYQYNNATDVLLEDVSIKSSFIPTKQRAIVTIHLIYSYNEFYTKANSDDREKMTKYLDKRLKQIGGFKLFDKDNRYQINFPRWQEKTQEGLKKAE